MRKISGVNKPLTLLPCLAANTSPPLLHTAAFHGNLHKLTTLLELGADPNERNAVNGQTPLMIACKEGKSACVEKLLQCGANALAFDSVKRRTCLHIACREGHYDCVVQILDVAKNGPIRSTWGFERFVNVLDNDGAIPLHMAARAGNTDIVNLLLNNGALVTAVTCKSTYGPGHGSTPLHYAARSGSLDCVEELLAWGADRTYKDMMGKTAYVVAMKRGHMACAAILDPKASEPLVWPSPLSFIRHLEPDTRNLLHNALSRANKKRRSSLVVPISPSHSSHATASKAKLISRRVLSLFRLHSKPNLALVCDNNPTMLVHSTLDQAAPSLEPQHSIENHLQLSSRRTNMDCMICFETSYDMIQVDSCGHHMCASCTIALCCHSKPDPNSSNASPPPPSCPFCRSDIIHLTVAKFASSTKK